MTTIKIKSTEKRKKKQPLLITGGYEQDIVCLMESDIIEEYLPMGSIEDKIIERVTNEYFMEDPETKLLIKF